MREKDFVAARFSAATLKSAATQRMNVAPGAFAPSASRCAKRATGKPGRLAAPIRGMPRGVLRRCPSSPCCRLAAPEALPC